MEKNSPCIFSDLSLDIPNQFAMRSGKPKEGEPVCRLSGKHKYIFGKEFDVLLMRIVLKQ